MEKKEEKMWENKAMKEFKKKLTSEEREYLEAIETPYCFDDEAIQTIQLTGTKEWIDTMIKKLAHKL